MRGRETRKIDDIGSVQFIAIENPMAKFSPEAVSYGQDKALLKQLSEENLDVLRTAIDKGQVKDMQQACLYLAQAQCIVAIGSNSFGNQNKNAPMCISLCIKAFENAKDKAGKIEALELAIQMALSSYPRSPEVVILADKVLALAREMNYKSKATEDLPKRLNEDKIRFHQLNSKGQLLTEGKDWEKHEKEVKEALGAAQRVKPIGSVKSLVQKYFPHSAYATKQEAITQSPSTLFAHAQAPVSASKPPAAPTETKTGDEPRVTDLRENQRRRP